MVEHVHVDALDLADVPHLVGVGDRLDREHRAVLAREADGGLAVAVDAVDDVRVDLAEQHHPGHLDGLRVGDAQALVEADLHPQALHVVGDVGAAAVHDHRVEADVLEQHDVGRERLAQPLLAHRGAAVLDHDRAAVELPDVRQRLEQRLDAGDALLCPSLRRHVVYSALIRMYSWVRSEK